jgi:Tfp pilus assembly protein PilW
MSLVEVLIAAMLGLILSASILTALYMQLYSYKLKTALESQQENASFALYFIRNDLAGIGFTGCFDNNIKLVSRVSNGLIGQHLAQFSKIQGSENQYKSSDAISFITVINPSADVIIDMATVHSSVDVESNSQILPMDELLITDCQHADLFAVSTIFNSRLSHDSINNQTANLKHVYPSGSIVYPLSKVSYKLSRGVSGRSGLYRQHNRAFNQELIADVEQLKIRYIIQGQTHKHILSLAASAVVDYADVIAIRVSLLLSTPLNVLRQRMTFVDAYGEKRQAQDQRYYKVYSLHVALPNRKPVKTDDS